MYSFWVVVVVVGCFFFFFKDCIRGPRDSQTNSIMLQMTDAVNPQTHKKENISNKPFLRGDIFNTDAQTRDLFVLSTAAMHFMRKAAFCLVFFFFIYFFYHLIIGITKERHSAESTSRAAITVAPFPRLARSCLKAEHG